ncbi:MAG TPA: NAD(P)H-binding protein [Amycolatopsis sp.]|nr:NAD(P)H-binding protein [Amycolatopsis sp.]
MGSALVPELLQAGHEVTALVRPGTPAEDLTTAGVRIHHGDLEDPASLRRGAATADGVIHLAHPGRTTRTTAHRPSPPAGTRCPHSTIESTVDNH